MRYAIIINKQVENIIAGGDSAPDLMLPAGQTIMPAHEWTAIGDMLINGALPGSQPEPLLTAEVREKTHAVTTQPITTTFEPAIAAPMLKAARPAVATADSASTAAPPALMLHLPLGAPADSSATATNTEQHAATETCNVDSVAPVKAAPLQDYLTAARNIEKDVLVRRVMAESSLYKQVSALLLDQQQAILHAVQAIILDTSLADAQKMEALEQLDTAIGLHL